MNSNSATMFLRDGFGTSSSRMLSIIPTVRKLPAKTPAMIVVISMMVISALAPDNSRTEGKS